VSRAALVAGAAAVFLGSWSLLHHGFLARSQLSDIPTYQRYAVGVRHDELPYRDFKIEYPPGVLPVVLLPSLRMQRDSDQAGLAVWFDREMALAGCLALLGTALCLRALGAGRLRTFVALGIVAVSPLLLGSVVLTRFDFWPAALAVLALAALLRGRLEVGAIVLGVAIGTKLWPALLVPPMFIWVRRTFGRREGWTWAGICAAIVVTIFLPFTLFSPSGMAHSFDTQLARPLQVESLASSILVASHHLFGTTAHSYQGAVSMDISGPGAHAAAIATTIAGALGLLLVWLLFARGPATPQRLATYCAASIAVFIAFGKVFSPQFMIWLIPFAVLASGPLGAVAQILLVAALLLTQSWFPRHYWELAIHLPGTQSAELLARNLVVLALAAVLAWKTPRAQLE
jgi:Glycosyltransferase family 87